MMKGCSGKSLEGGIGFSRAAVAVSAVLQMLSDSWTSPVEAGWNQQCYEVKLAVLYIVLYKTMVSLTHGVILVLMKDSNKHLITYLSACWS